MDIDKNMEIFKGIPGYPGYQVSNYGRVWNGKTQRYLKPSKMANGYMQINLIAANGKRKKELVHRIMAITFLPNPDGLPQVDHIDRVRDNNILTNLRWVSRSENQRNKTDNRKIKVFDLNHNLIAEYDSIAECADELDGSIPGIYSYLEGYQKSPYKKQFILEVL